MKEHEKALNAYFKVEILDDKTQKAYRPIAWTAFLLKKYDIADKYYSKVLKTKPTLHDFLNAGHVQLSMNNLKQALEYYKHAAILVDDMEQFMSLVIADSKILNSHGIASDTISYLFNQIKYSLD